MAHHVAEIQPSNAHKFNSVSSPTVGQDLTPTYSRKRSPARLRAVRRFIRGRPIGKSYGNGEANLSYAEIADGLAKLPEPIITTERTVARDIAALRDEATKYLNTRGFESRIKIGAPAPVRSARLPRHITRARKDAAMWAALALKASKAKTALLIETGLVGRP